MEGMSMEGMDQRKVEKFLAYLETNIERLWNERGRAKGRDDDYAYYCKLEAGTYEAVKTGFSEHTKRT